MTALTVRKHDWRGAFRYAWEGELIVDEPPTLVIAAIWQGPGEPTVGEIRFEMGDRFTEYYYLDRPCALWQIARADGTLKGWYCNVNTLPAREGDVLSFNDLLLDVIAYPDGRFMVLDRDEFAAAREAGLPREQAILAEQGLAEIVGMLQQGAPPFCFDPGNARASWTVAS
jgi:predicted RNA-binding protein associated with RNAse of E/G family